MKKLISLLSIITLVVITGFIAVGCNNANTDPNNIINTNTDDTGSKPKILTGTVAITGTAQAGQTLTANTGSLGGSGAVNYQWKRGESAENVNTSISGAASSTYTLDTADESKYIKVTVTRTGYSGSIDSNAIGPVYPAQAAMPTVTGVTVTPAAASVLKGKTQQFTAEVTGDNYPPQGVNWTVTGGGTGTGITSDGLLTVAANETAASLTVKAVSELDSGKSGTATVTVLSPTVTSVTITPATASVHKGETQQFTAAVTGTNNPATTVTWTVTGGGNGTSIASNGILTVAFGETATSLTVRATSTVDTSKSGTATVTVTVPPLTGTVSITGTAQAGQTLTANISNLTGNTQSSYQWTRADSSTGAYTNISGATSSTYAVVADDVGKHIKVTVSRSGYSGNVTSDAVGPVLAAQAATPTVTSVTVTPATASVLKGGTHQFNAAVTGNNNPATTVTWTVTGGGTGTSIASNGTLTVSANETAASLTIKAASTVDSSKSGTATVTIPALTGSVSITGTTQTGQVLTANTGSLDGSGTISYQWTQAGSETGTYSNISGATSSTYTLAIADSGKYIKVTVTRSGYRNSITSAATAQITFPALSGTVSISGTIQVGQTLTASTGSLNGNGTISYQWKRGDTSSDAGTNIGTNSSTYTLVSADLNKYIKVTVTRTENTGSVNSNTLGPITLPALTGSVTITGDVQAEKVLTANTGSLGGSGTISYQWTRADTSGGTYNNISGATSSTYTPVMGDVGKYIKVTVTRSGYSGSVTSTATGAVAQPALTGTVSITGTAQVGNTLTANTGSLNGTGTISYQWAQASTSTGTYTNISGATSSTYTLVSGDVNKYIRVTVTRSGYTGSANSAAIGPVQQATEVVQSTNTSSTVSSEGLKSTGTDSYQIVNLPPENREYVMKITGANLGYAVAEYSLAAYKGKEITLTLSVDVKRVGAVGTLDWQINNDNYPSVVRLANAAQNTWHTMNGSWTGTPSDTNPALYLSTYENSSSSTTYYIDNFSVTIKETSTGGGGTFNGVTWTNADLGSTTHNKMAKSDGYDFEFWNQDRKGTASITLGSGGTFKCSWTSNIENILFRAGRKYNSTQTHSQIGTFSIEYAGTVNLGTSANYLSVYGWTRNPLIEYYIVDNYGWNPINGSGVVLKGTATIDGEVYDLFTAPRVNAPSIDKDNDNFTQYFSVRRTKRSSGTISVSQHFAAWAANGMTDINTGKLYEVSLKVEGYKSAGSAEITKNILKINGTPIQ